MYSDKLPKHKKFQKRLLAGGIIAVTLVALALCIGILGYHLLGNLPWVDSYLNASMILSGMGPVDPLPTPAAKIFSGTYALFSGVMFITSIGVFFAPILHRILHKFHLEDK